MVNIYNSCLGHPLRSSSLCGPILAAHKFQVPSQKPNADRSVLLECAKVFLWSFSNWSCSTLKVQPASALWLPLSLLKELCPPQSSLVFGSTSSLKNLLNCVLFSKMAPGPLGDSNIAFRYKPQNTTKKTTTSAKAGLCCQATLSPVACKIILTWHRGSFKLGKFPSVVLRTHAWAYFGRNTFTSTSFPCRNSMLSNTSLKINSQSSELTKTRIKQTHQSCDWNSWKSWEKAVSCQSCQGQKLSSDPRKDVLWCTWCRQADQGCQTHTQLIIVFFLILDVSFIANKCTECSGWFETGRTNMKIRGFCVNLDQSSPISQWSRLTREYSIL